jgi:hypothetical protein
MSKKNDLHERYVIGASDGLALIVEWTDFSADTVIISTLDEGGEIAGVAALGIEEVKDAVDALQKFLIDRTGKPYGMSAEDIVHFVQSSHGKAKSAAKSEAARRNGRLGGRPVKEKLADVEADLAANEAAHKKGR